jgi:hypothetical protein
MVIHGSWMMCLIDKSVNNHPKQNVNHQCLDTVGDHTTASMVVELDNEIKVWLTGSSTP